MPHDKKTIRMDEEQIEKPYDDKPIRMPMEYSPPYGVRVNVFDVPDGDLFPGMEGGEGGDMPLVVDGEETVQGIVGLQDGGRDLDFDGLGIEGSRDCSDRMQWFQSLMEFDEMASAEEGATQDPSVSALRGSDVFNKRINSGDVMNLGDQMKKGSEERKMEDELRGRERAKSTADASTQTAVRNDPVVCDMEEYQPLYEVQKHATVKRRRSERRVRSRANPFKMVLASEAQTFSRAKGTKRKSIPTSAPIVDPKSRRMYEVLMKKGGSATMKELVHEGFGVMQVKGMHTDGILLRKGRGGRISPFKYHWAS